jgi:thiamine pyrophosphate-dependent acetolactate synthase large subunit-like protein
MMDRTTIAGPAAERPVNVEQQTGNPEYGSDLIVDLLDAMGIEYVVMNPGSTFRGIHDSIVNYGANRAPKLLLALHEAVAVGIAHGYAKAAGRPMAVALHDVVGLGNAPTAIYEAWTDRVPIVILGGTGPVDASLRRPGNDWIHTALIQGNLIRDFVKWDDQPASIAAVPESLLRAHRVAVSRPAGPVYVCFDALVQEGRIDHPIDFPEVDRFAPPRPIWGDPNAVDEAARLLVEAEFPVISSGRVCRDQAGLDGLVELADLLAAPTFPIYRNGLNFPSAHPLNFMGQAESYVPDADVILGAEPLDFTHVTRRFPTRAIGQGAPITRDDARFISVGLDDLALRSWASEFQRLSPVDIPIMADTAVGLHQLAEACRSLIDSAASERIEARRARLLSDHKALMERAARRVADTWNDQPISLGRLLTEVRDAVSQEDEFLLLKNRFWIPGIWDIAHVDRFLGDACGGTMGYGPPAMIGGALAVARTPRFAVGITGDGDFNYTASALWTAAHYEIPCLIVVFNNRSYQSDVEFQDHIARERNRPVENRSIGHAMDSPPVDIAGLARSYGCAGMGPVESPSDLAPTLERAVRQAKEGRTVVVDVLVQPR